MMDALDQRRARRDRRAQSITEVVCERILADARAGLDDQYELTILRARDLVDAVCDPERRGDTAVLIVAPERRDACAAVTALRVAAHAQGVEAWAAPHAEEARALLRLGPSKHLVGVVLMRR
ncbi:MAG: hypothetical protein ACXWP4_21275 [Polyangiales bacterium]